MKSSATIQLFITLFVLICHRFWMVNVNNKVSSSWAPQTPLKLWHISSAIDPVESRYWVIGYFYLIDHIEYWKCIYCDCTKQNYDAAVNNALTKRQSKLNKRIKPDTEPENTMQFTLYTSGTIGSFFHFHSRFHYNVQHCIFDFTFSCHTNWNTHWLLTSHSWNVFFWIT